MTGSLAEHGKIEFGHRIGGQHLDLLAGREAFQCLADMPDRLRTGHAAAIDHPDTTLRLAHG